jgi:hypothetical protein
MDEEWRDAVRKGPDYIIEAPRAVESRRRWPRPFRTFVTPRAPAEPALTPPARRARRRSPAFRDPAPGVLPSRPVKFLRAFVLLLVAVLLPVRGVLAAAMICPHASALSASQVAHLPAALKAVDLASPMHHHALHVHAPAAAGAPHDHGQSANHSASAHACTLCASCGFTVPLGPTFSPTVASLEPVASSLPPLRVPAPSFLSGGPERPPRSA